MAQQSNRLNLAFIGLSYLYPKKIRIARPARQITITTRILHTIHHSYIGCLFFTAGIIAALLIVSIISSSAQSIIPPTNAPFASTNEVPMPWKDKHEEVIIIDHSPGIVLHKIYKGPTLSGPWTFYGSTTIGVFLVDITNGPVGFYKATSVNSAGIESQL